MAPPHSPITYTCPFGHSYQCPEDNPIASIIDFLNAIKENVSSINVWDYLIVENSNELGFSFASSNEEYDFYAILNNNPRNFDYFNNRVLKNKSNEIIVFDPWRIVTLNQISASNDVKLIHYFSLSHYQKIII
jgi:hypothetical protein